MRVLHYLKNVPGTSIFLHTHSINQLKTYNVFYWAIYPKTKKKL